MVDSVGGRNSPSLVSKQQVGSNAHGNKRGRPPNGCTSRRKEKQFRLQEEIIIYDKHCRDRVSEKIAAALSVANVSWNCLNTPDHDFESSVESLLLEGTLHGTVDAIKRMFRNPDAVQKAFHFVSDVLSVPTDGRRTTVKHNKGDRAQPISGEKDSSHESTDPNKSIRRFYHKNVVALKSTVTADLCNVLNLGPKMVPSDLSILCGIGNGLVRHCAMLSSTPCSVLGVLTPAVVLSASLAYASQIKMNTTLSVDTWLERFNAVYASWVRLLMDCKIGVGKEEYARYLFTGSNRDVMYNHCNSPLLLRLMFCILISTGFRQLLCVGGGNGPNMGGAALNARRCTERHLWSSDNLRLDSKLWEQFALLLEEGCDNFSQDMKVWRRLVPDSLVMDIMDRNLFASSQTLDFDKMVQDVVEATKTKMRPARTLHASVCPVLTHFKDHRAQVTSIQREDLFHCGSPTPACVGLKAVVNSLMNDIGSIMELSTQLACSAIPVSGRGIKGSEKRKNCIL